MSGNRWALIHELRGHPEPDLGELLAKLAPVDLVLIEGFKRTTSIKIEVYRPSLGKPLIYPADRSVVAVAVDMSVPLPTTIPTLALDDVEAIADFVVLQAIISVGEEDYVRDALRDLGAELAVHKVAMKPGKPLA